MRVLALYAALSVAGCYAPALHDGQYACTDGNHSCPSGQVCSRCNVCVAAGDANGAAACPGCAAGTRSTGDQGLFALAFCNGAWTVPGVTSSASMATPCNRQPGDDGTNGAGTACSVEDNCAPGWHVCTGDAEARAAGLSSARCDSLDAQHAFWLTRQPTSVDVAKGPMCTASGSAGLIGCGALETSVTTSMCSALTRYLGNDLTSTCASVSSNNWQCGTTPGMEAASVTKPSMSRGGVLCCRDM